MTILNIITYPDARLKEKAQEVVNFDKNLHKLLDDMKETMYHADGIGLAATQVAVMQRVAVIDVSEERNSPIELVNPKITVKEGKVSSKEGCLSIPDFRESITRATKVTVVAFDRNGKEFSFEAQELLSFCVQHELDHLDGILFVDHLSGLKKNLFLKWAQKNL
jgi:peptide deformylase